MRRTQLNHTIGIFREIRFLLQTIHIYAEKSWAKFATISSMIGHTNKAKTKSRYVQEKTKDFVIN